MKVVLKTDFRDYYDHWFDRAYSGDEEYIEFDRRSRNEIAKWAQFKAMEHMNLRVPKHGLVKDIELGIGRKVVVYTDPLAHAGEGKRKMLMADALQQYPNNYCSEFIQCNSSYPRTTRVLTIGYSLSVTLSYTGSIYTDWRSNVGDVGIKILDVDLEPIHYIPLRPLVAVDFVTDATTREKYAIDLNVAPQLKWTGLEEVYDAKYIADLIKSALHKG